MEGSGRIDDATKRRIVIAGTVCGLLLVVVAVAAWSEAVHEAPGHSQELMLVRSVSMADAEGAEQGYEGLAAAQEAEGDELKASGKTVSTAKAASATVTHKTTKVSDRLRSLSAAIRSANQRMDTMGSALDRLNGLANRRNSASFDASAEHEEDSDANNGNTDVYTRHSARLPAQGSSQDYVDTAEMAEDARANGSPSIPWGRDP